VCASLPSIRDAPDVSIMDGEELERTGDFGLNADTHMAEHVAAILRKGLGDRVGMVATRMHGALAPWDVTEACLVDNQAAAVCKIQRSFYCPIRTRN
jgi:hypothetical protein